MILGIGNDVVSTSRIAKLVEEFGQRFLDRVYTVQEQAEAKKRGVHEVAALARRYAAKEAASKALGTGFRGKMGLKDIEVVTTEYGKPELAFHGAARERFEAMMPGAGNVSAHVSLSDEIEFSSAVVVLEFQPRNGT